MKNQYHMQKKTDNDLETGLVHNVWIGMRVPKHSCTLSEGVYIKDCKVLAPRPGSSHLWRLPYGKSSRRASLGTEYPIAPMPTEPTKYSKCDKLTNGCAH